MISTYPTTAGCRLPKTSTVLASSAPARGVRSWAMPRWPPTPPLTSPPSCSAPPPPGSPSTRRSHPLLAPSSPSCSDYVDTTSGYHSLESETGPFLLPLTRAPVVSRDAKSNKRFFTFHRPVLG